MMGGRGKGREALPASPEGAGGGEIQASLRRGEPLGEPLEGG